MPKRPPPPLILPNSLDPIAYIIGLDRAMRLARRVPRRSPRPGAGSVASLYIPRPDHLADEHPLVLELGTGLALAVCEELGGEHWWPPSGAFIEGAILARQVLDLAEIGITSSEAAERCGTSEKWASNILKAHEAWQATGDLDAVRRASSLRPGFFSLMMNRGW